MIRVLDTLIGVVLGLVLALLLVLTGVWQAQTPPASTCPDTETVFWDFLLQPASSPVTLPQRKF